ncbi:MAG: hypothetical protein WC070_01795 [Candidatus Magasanikbacteria bacterium]
MKNNNKIPNIKIDFPLVSRFLPIILVGSEKVLDEKSKLYIRLLFRLVDKSWFKYEEVKESLEEEIKTGDKLIYRINIINNLEDCLYAINRFIKIFDIIINGKNDDKRKINLLKYIDKKTINRLKKYNVSKIRNRVEHINEDIFYNTFKKDLFLDVSEDYKSICINNRYLLISDLIKIIEDYHDFVLEIFNNLPNRIENGKFYYDKK